MKLSKKRLFALAVLVTLILGAVYAYRSRSLLYSPEDLVEADLISELGFDLSHLTELQYFVTQEMGTELAFQNEYWDNKEEGIYVDIVSGEALFSSRDKFDSGTGWPSFTRPIDYEFVTEHEDNRYFLNRIEIRSAIADSHLGHVFEDAPPELGSIRYCMNSAALRFIPKNKMEEEGYGEFLSEL